MECTSTGRDVGEDGYGLMRKKAVVRITGAAGPKPHVLVCAPSNAALDEIVARLLRYGLLDRLRLLPAPPFFPARSSWRFPPPFSFFSCISTCASVPCLSPAGLCLHSSYLAYPISSSLLVSFPRLLPAGLCRPCKLLLSCLPQCFSSVLPLAPRLFPSAFPTLFPSPVFPGLFTSGFCPPSTPHLVSGVSSLGF